MAKNKITNKNKARQKKKTPIIKTLADCIMDGGIGGKYFRDMNNDYNKTMEMWKECKMRGELITSQRVFPSAINRAPYKVISLYTRCGQDLKVKIYLKGIENKRSTSIETFSLRKHLNDELYE
tara:strand:- start:224 stop:592 length:369 start_codon:yes stop_codon:yes gene_type:complete